MKNYATALLVSLFVMSVQYSFGQLNYLKYYSNSGYDVGEGVVQLEDSSYVICGASSSFTNGPSQAFLLKVDSLGNKIWSNHYGGFESESARRVLYKKNFGFFITGFTNSFGNGGYDAYLAKVDESGILEWQKSYGGEGWDRIHDAAMTSDTGAILVGEMTSVVGETDWYVIRTNSSGDTLWTKTFGGQSNDVATCIERYQDSLFVIGGNIIQQDSIYSKSMILILDENGVVYDYDTINIAGLGELNDIIISNDTIQGIGVYKDHDTSQYNVRTYTWNINLTDLTQISISQVTSYGDFEGDLITNLSSTGNRYIVSRVSNNNWVVGPGPDLVISKLSAGLGWLGNQSGLAEANPDVGGQMIPTIDGGAALVGFRGGVGARGGTVFLLKVGVNDAFPTISPLIYVNELVEVVEITSLFEANLYPNPTDNSLTIELKEAVDYDFQIVNTLGQTVYSDKIFGTKSIDVSNLQSGIYTLIFNSAGEAAGSYRLVIQ